MFQLYLELTQTCRYQLAPGARMPNTYGISCRATFTVIGAPHRVRSRS